MKISQLNPDQIIKPQKELQYKHTKSISEPDITLDNCTREKRYYFDKSFDPEVFSETEAAIRKFNFQEKIKNTLNPLFGLLLTLLVHAGPIAANQYKPTINKDNIPEKTERLNAKEIPADIHNVFKTPQLKNALQKELLDKTYLTPEDFRSIFRKLYKENKEDFFQAMDYGTYFLVAEYFHVKEISYMQLMRANLKLQKVYGDLENSDDVRKAISENTGRYNPHVGTLSSLFVDYLNLDQTNYHDDLNGNCASRFMLEASLLKHKYPELQTYAVLTAGNKVSPGHIQLYLYEDGVLTSYTKDTATAENAETYRTEDYILSTLGFILEFEGKPKPNHTRQSLEENDFFQYPSLDIYLTSNGITTATEPPKPEPIIINTPENSNYFDKMTEKEKAAHQDYLFIKKFFVDIVKVPLTSPYGNSTFLASSNSDVIAGSLEEFAQAGLMVVNGEAKPIPPELKAFAKSKLDEAFFNSSNKCAYIPLYSKDLITRENCTKKDLLKIYPKLSPDKKEKVLEIYPELKTHPVVKYNKFWVEKTYYRDHKNQYYKFPDNQILLQATKDFLKYKIQNKQVLFLTTSQLKFLQTKLSQAEIEQLYGNSLSNFLTKEEVNTHFNQVINKIRKEQPKQETIFLVYQMLIRIKKSSGLTHAEKLEIINEIQQTTSQNESYDKFTESYLELLKLIYLSSETNISSNDLRKHTNIIIDKINKNPSYDNLQILAHLVAYSHNTEFLELVNKTTNGNIQYSFDVNPYSSTSTIDSFFIKLFSNNKNIKAHKEYSVNLSKNPNTSIQTLIFLTTQTYSEEARVAALLRLFPFLYNQDFQPPLAKSK